MKRCENCGEWCEESFWHYCAVTGLMAAREEGKTCRAFWSRKAGRPVTVVEHIPAPLESPNGACDPACPYWVESDWAGIFCFKGWMENNMPGPQCPRGKGGVMNEEEQKERGLSTAPTNVLVAELAGRGLGTAVAEAHPGGLCNGACPFFILRKNDLACELNAALDYEGQGLHADPAKCPAILKKAKDDKP